METSAHFVVATPARSVCDENARALERHGNLRLLLLGTRRGTAGVPPERTRLKPAIGLSAYIAARTLPSFKAEAFRFGLLPWFDRWARRQLQPGDHIISSYGNANECFAWVRAHGGRTFIDAGNTHPENYWDVLADEYARWNCRLDPFPRNWFERSRAMMPLVDYVLSPSSHVTGTFLARGFRPEQILRNIYPVNLDCFRPSASQRPIDRPLTIVSTGAPSLRKGTPYLLEAFRIIRRTHPTARLRLTDSVHDSLRPLMSRWNDLPIEWTPPLPHPALAAHLQQSDVFVLPSLEEGLVRTACEAMACGLPVVLTPNTGANDFIQPGINGEIVPLRDASAIAEAALKCFERLRSCGPPTVTDLHERLSLPTFERDFIRQLRERGLLEAAANGA